MNQWGPGWDVHSQYESRPDDYRVEANGPYTSPPEPAESSKPPRYGWGTFITVAVLAVLFVIGLAVSASRDDEVVQIPNTVLNPTRTPAVSGYSLPSQRSDPTLSGLVPPSHFTPQAHKPGPPATGVTEYMPDDGQYLVGPQIKPGTYSAVCAVEFCSWTRAEYDPDLGVEFGVAYSYYLPPKDRPVVGGTVIVKILPSDSSFITNGFTSWVRS